MCHLDFQDMRFIAYRVARSHPKETNVMAQYIRLSELWFLAVLVHVNSSIHTIFAGNFKLKEIKT